MVATTGRRVGLKGIVAGFGIPAIVLTVAIIGMWKATRAAAQAPAAGVPPPPPPQTAWNQLLRTRPAGARFECESVVQLSGTVKRTNKLEYLFPVFGARGDAKYETISRFKWETLVSRNNGKILNETWTVRTADALRLLCPPEFSQISYDFSAPMETVLSSCVEAGLSSPELITQVGSWMGLGLLALQNRNLAPFAKLLGVEQAMLARSTEKLGLLAKRIGTWEGKSATLGLKDGVCSWGYTDAPDDMQKYFNTIKALIDLRLLPPPGLKVGESFTCDEVSLSLLMPPDIILLPEYKANLNLTREQDRQEMGRLYQVFAVTGDLEIKWENASLRTGISSGSTMLVDATATTNVFVRNLSLMAPIKADKLAKGPELLKVDWAGDLQLRIQYDVRPRSNP